MQTTSLLSKLSIICLTYERHPFVRRQIVYFKDFPTKIIFVDGSCSHLDIEPNGKVGLLEWWYIHIPGEDTYQKRMRTALDLIDTEYVCFMDDADVLFASGLSSAIKELESKSNLVFAGGKVARSISYNNTLIFDKDGHYTDNFSVIDDDPGSRLLSIIESVRTANIYYVVIRTKEFKDIIYKSTLTKFSYPSAFELLFTGLLSIRGKYEMGQYPFWMRGDEQSIGYSNKPNVVGWFAEKTEEVTYIKTVLSEELTNYGYSSHDAYLKAEKYVNIHQYHVNSESQTYQKQRKEILLDLIFPYAIRKKIVKLLGDKIYALCKKNKAFRFFFRSILGKDRVNNFIITKIYSDEQNYKIFYLLPNVRLNSDIIKFWEKQCGELSQEQKLDLLQTRISCLDIIKFWERQCGELSQEQKSDLLRVYFLLQKFPKGIDSNQGLFDAASSSSWERLDSLKTHSEGAFRDITN